MIMVNFKSGISSHIQITVLKGQKMHQSITNSSMDDSLKIHWAKQDEPTSVNDPGL
jgi:hypothetical protein